MQVLNTLWVGDQLGKLEQLCVLSGLAAGHPYHVYSYEPDKLRGVPDGAEVRDAAEVMPRHRLLAYAECNSYALGANFWRYEMLRQGAAIGSTSMCSCCVRSISISPMFSEPRSRGPSTMR
ncbi:hypothetical protein H9L15_07720 [Sphingomonas daechungensis]|uniref:Uncharacterized protein n=1 Tax=Sphingomonas daechungensis TaxID=1176646 RepID=A0ABX6SXX3_9SPHN|nr:hypothetical protein [Sphingomonas daechungensis]QNP42260.1 hypothetical protein H9L15_07720 [Sphingomonas daechungensis]